ncbi:MAG TPA: UvrD-helicase domain-containing protein, partial [Candidatus Hydrogenedens sp.]|nr:UvrD-helicase domain-containing protein [Candidatus Hydrogenedens sp.]
MTPLKQHNVFKTLTEEQKNAVFSDARVIGVDASAGSGKTRVLTARILRLLIEKQIDLNDIVAITFTEKASAEMKQRLRDAFREFATHANSQELTRWRWLEQQLESAHICTIHSFCSSILREYALKLGFNPDFRIIDEQENFLLLDKFIREQLLNHIE